jgi:hypothetical protein
MGGSATDDALVKPADNVKGNSGKNKTVKQPESRRSPSKGKSTGKKAVSRNRQAGSSSTEKNGKRPARAGKPAAGDARITADPEKIALQTGSEENEAASATAAAVTTNPENTPGQDSRSISWMSAQAVNALNAVRANQARKAESLLARVEKPVPGRPAITELPEQTSEDLLEEIPGMETAAAGVPQTDVPQEPRTTSPASTGETSKIQKETAIMQDKSGEQESPAAETAGHTTEEAAMTASDSSEAGPVAPTEAVVAAQAQQPGLPVRPIVATVFVALLAFSGYRYWQDHRDSQVAAPPVAGSYSETVQDAAWDDIPQQEAIAVVGATPGEQPPPDATTPGMATGDSAQVNTDTVADPAATAAMAPTGSTSDGDSEVFAAQPAEETATPSTGRAVPETPEPADTATIEPAAQPESAAEVAPPPVRPAQPQPRYGAPGSPGYGYYPQQPNWQQPYYQPAYPPQYPAR